MLHCIVHLNYLTSGIADISNCVHCPENRRRTSYIKQTISNDSALVAPTQISIH